MSGVPYRVLFLFLTFQCHTANEKVMKLFFQENERGNSIKRVNKLNDIWHITCRCTSSVYFNNMITEVD